ncbi:MAG TPA: hypothetical protein VFX92_03875 [Candidatus Krumholzibacteria bacterium]|nr:hypothetical protein [Candidatus Krumholzibacteria bacterium]
MTTLRHSGAARLVILFLFAASTAVLTACYTLVQHPRVASMNFRRPQGEACTACHEPAAIRAFVRQEHLAAETGAWAVLDDPWWVEPDTTGGGR